VSMDIFSPPGTKVVFSRPDGGYPYDVTNARECLVVGCAYTVYATYVGQSRTDVRLVEIPSRTFNSVHFDELRADKPLPAHSAGDSTEGA
jgi:hypothetical protein